MTEREEDRDLAYEQFPSMNRTFYASSWGPEQYITSRLRALVLAASDSPEIAGAAADGIKFGELEIRYGSDDWSEEVAKDFLATESSVLLHHAAETMFRLYFAHAGTPPCPWLETARLRSFSAFKKRTSDLATSLNDPVVQASVMDVFTGNPSSAQLPASISEEAWNAQREGLVALLAAAADALLGDSNLYNAAKHGLAVFPAQLGISFGFPETEPEPDIDISMEGQTLQYLQVVENQGRKIWQKSSAWVFAESNLSMTYLIARQIASLMSVAKARYVKGTGQFAVRPVTTEMVRVASTAGWPKKPILLQSFGEGLVYYASIGDETDQGGSPG